MERQYRPIEAPKSQIMKYLKAFNYAFLTRMVKLLLLLYISTTVWVYLYSPPKSLGEVLLLSLFPIILIMYIYGIFTGRPYTPEERRNNDEENVMLSAKYFWIPGNAWNQDRG